MIRLILLITTFILTSSITCGGIIIGTGTCTSCSYCSSGRCISCCSGYGVIAVNSGTCVACLDSTCAYCQLAGTVSEYCTSCKSIGYYPKTGATACTLCSASNELNCNTINGCGSTTTTCTNCQMFGMNSANQCLNCSLIYRHC